MNFTQPTENIMQIVSPHLGSNIFYIKDKKILIDTGSPQDKEEFKNVLNQIGEVKKVIVTHAHFDHIGNLDIFQDIPIICSSTTKEIIENKDDSYMLFNMIGETPPEFPVNNLEIYEDNSDDFTFLETPGHLIGSIVIYDENNKYLFSGDLLFDGYGVGRTDLKGGNLEELKTSLEKIKDIDINKTFPGHGPVSELKELVSGALDRY